MFGLLQVRLTRQDKTQDKTKDDGLVELNDIENDDNERNGLNNIISSNM